MRDIVVHRSGREINLSEPTPEDERLLREVYENRDKVLRCQAHDGDVYLWMRKQDNSMWASHWPGTAGAGATHAVVLMSTEHKVQAEYVVRAADRAGLPAATEVVLPNRARPDVVVNGDTGFEAQRSGITLAKIKTRTTRAIRGGLRTTTWISDAETAPPWMGVVPAVRVFARSWLRLPGPGEAEVRGGLVQLDRRQCTWREWPTGCPEYGGRHCGQWHVTRERANATTLDELTVGLAVGLYVPVRIRKLAFIAGRDAAERFDVPHWAPPPAKARTLRAADRVECHAVRPDAPAGVCCGSRSWAAGGPLVLGCQLCPQSPTYYRRAT